MAMDQTSKFCNVCNRLTMWARPGTNHILHLLLTLFVCGMWIPVWILASIRIGGWRCQSCGNSGSLLLRLITPVVAALMLLVVLPVFLIAIVAPFVSAGGAGRSRQSATQAKSSSQADGAAVDSQALKPKPDVPTEESTDGKKPAPETVGKADPGSTNPDATEKGIKGPDAGPQQLPSTAAARSPDDAGILTRPSGKVQYPDDSPPKPKLRSWTSADGKFSVEAEYVGRMNDKVTLRRSDGKTITVDLARLCDSDREFVESKARQAK